MKLMPMEVDVGDLVIINLITSTTTSTGLKVYARLGETDYPKGIGGEQRRAR